tara:strand:+ start:350 stop:1054 length:705 start_codon:yes stop_codon:yes gene_type:complete
MGLLAIIPARGGSKGIPRKNIKKLCGKPLIAWTIEVAQQVKQIDRVFVSTDDEEIAKVAEMWGAKIPFLRPPELATDRTSSVATALQVLDMLPEFDEIIWLQPTSPLRTRRDINEVIELTQQRSMFSIVSVCPAKVNPNWIYKLNEKHLLAPWNAEPLILNRQGLPQAYILNGSIYWAKVEWLKKKMTFVSNESYGYVMPTERSIDLDTPLDWEWAEFLMRRDVGLESVINSTK